MRPQQDSCYSIVSEAILETILSLLKGGLSAQKKGPSEQKKEQKVNKK